MDKICFVFSSRLEENPDNLIRKYITCAVDYDILYLSTSEKEKILKKDIDLDMTTLDKYRLVCLIGAEPLKHIAKLTGVQKYNGHLIENKYLPIMNPNIVTFKPQLRAEIETAFKNIEKVLTNKYVGVTADKDYLFVTTNDELNDYRKQLDNCTDLCVDIETTSLSSRKGTIIGIALSTKPHQGIFIDIEVIKANRSYFDALFKSKNCVFHNAKFDMQFIEDELGFTFPQWEDTILMHYVLEEAVGTHGLKLLAMRFTDLGDYDRELDMFKKSFCRTNKIKVSEFNYGMLPLNILAPYAQKDADACMQLYYKFKPLIDRNKNFSNLYYNVLKPATTALIKLERNGGPIDLERLNSLSENYDIDIEECLAEITRNKQVKMLEARQKKEFNPNSVFQMRTLFFDIIGVQPTKKTGTGADSVDKEVLAGIDHPLAEAILELREKSKMAGTYISNIVEGLDKDNRLRSGFNITGTTSGRLSSSGNLNYQNIPRDNKDIKKIFKARPGYKIVQCD
jgi:DNA polymerase I-like protein with 3'-5' exonuclease and polymerase domains